jgi:hypothetical protein
MTDQVDFFAPVLPEPVRSEPAARPGFVAVGRRQVWPGTGTRTAQRLFDVVEELEGADTVKPKKPVDQQDWILSVAFRCMFIPFSRSGRCRASL